MPESKGAKKGLVPVSVRGVVRLLDFLGESPWEATDLRLLAAMTSRAVRQPELKMSDIEKRARMPHFQCVYRLESLVKKGWVIRRCHKSINEVFYVDAEAERRIAQICQSADVSRGGIIRTMAAYTLTYDFHIFRILFLLKMKIAPAVKELELFLNGMTLYSIEVALARAERGLGYVVRDDGRVRLSETGDAWVDCTLKHINSPLVLP